MQSLTPISDAMRLEAERATQAKADRLEAAKRLADARKRLEKEGPAANAAATAANAKIVALREKFVKENEEAHQAARIAEGLVMQLRADVDRELAALAQTMPHEVVEIGQRIDRLTDELRTRVWREPDYEAKLSRLQQARLEVSNLATLPDGDKAIASARSIYGSLPDEIKNMLDDGLYIARSALARAS